MFIHTFVNKQVYDHDLTTDDFMGSASYLLSDLEFDKWVFVCLVFHIWSCKRVF